MITNQYEVMTRLIRLKESNIISKLRYAHLMKMINHLINNRPAVALKKVDFKKIEEFCKIKFTFSGNYIVGVCALIDHVPAKLSSDYLITDDLLENEIRAQIAANLSTNPMAEQYTTPLTGNNSVLEFAISSILNGTVNDPINMPTIVSNICFLFGGDHIRGICERAVLIELLADFDRPISQITYTLLERHDIYQAPDGSMTIIPLNNIALLLNYRDYVSKLPADLRANFIMQYRNIIKANNTQKKIYAILTQIYTDGVLHWRTIGCANKIINLFANNSMIRILARKAQGCAHSKFYRELKLRPELGDTGTETCQTAL